MTEIKYFDLWNKRKRDELSNWSVKSLKLPIIESNVNISVNLLSWRMYVEKSMKLTIPFNCIKESQIFMKN